MPDFGVLRSIAKGTRKAKTKPKVPPGSKAEARAAAAEAAAEQSSDTAITSGTQTTVEGGEQTQAMIQMKAQEAAEQTAQQAGATGQPPAAGTPTLAAAGPPLRPILRRPGKPRPAAKAAPEASERVLATTPAGERLATEVEAARVGSLELGRYDLDEIYQINFDRIVTTDDVKAVIADTAERNKVLIQESRRGKIANEQLRALAADLNVEEEVIRPVLEREMGGVINPEQVVAARQVLVSSASRIRSLAEKIKAGTANDLERLQFRRQLMFHDDYQTAFMGARAETGRALNAFNIPVGDELAISLPELRRSVDNLMGNDTDELARMVLEMESTGQVSRFTRQYSRSRVAGVVQELFINNILSGPKTHLVNVAGSVLMGSMNPAEFAVAAQIGKILPGADHVMVGEATAMLLGQVSGWRDAMRYAWLAFKSGEPADAVVRYGGHTRRAISSRNLFPEGAPPSIAAMVDLIGSAIRIPTERVMIPADEFFKHIAYRGDLTRQAYREVMQRQVGGTKMTADEIALFVQNYVENPGALAQKQAKDFARYITFQTELGVTGRAAQKFIESFPGGFIVAPFVRTPTNIFKAGLFERSPLGLFTKTFWQAVENGGPERDLAIARVSMGSATVTAVALAALSGRVTGGGPQDPAARRLLEASGWQPYSIVYEDPLTGELKYQSYARAEPLAFVVGATADLVEIRAYMNADDPLASDEENMNRAIAAIVAAVANNTMSKTYMQGVADFSQALEDPQRYFNGWMARSSQALLPYSAFRRQITMAQDPLVREAWDYTERLRATAGLAGYSEGLPPRRDVFGEPVRHRGGPVLGVFSPFPQSTDKADPIVNELVSIMEKTGSVPVRMPSRKIDGMRLTTAEYEQLVVAARKDANIGSDTGAGMVTFRDKLNDLFSSPLYLLATPDGKAALIKQVREQADEAGRAVLERDNEEFAARLELHRRKQQELMRGPEAP